MIEIPARALPRELGDVLDELQAKLDALPHYAERVEAAKRAWDSKPRERFRAVRDVLTAMCSGEDRCMYCEDSTADEIEHVRPKSLYPDHTFRWPNYLLTCGPCNGFKNNRFGVLSAGRRAFVELARPPGAAVVQPEPGTMVLLDPRREDPLRFMILDLVFPFVFRPLHGRGCVARARAAYTIEVLGLNRDPLPRRREHAYGSYLDRLGGYVVEPDPRARERRRDALLRLDHPTVWREMQRQHRSGGELRRLFEEAPEALGW
jgi:uncharacterized protein (TIGR02646 family)